MPRTHPVGVTAENGGQDSKAEGILLYPAVNQTLHYEYMTQGHRIPVRTVELARTPAEITVELLAMLN
jgi:hypothetical protein